MLTIEGLAAPDGPLHPMQEAFRENHGLQCGFCTPGMVMSAVDMVNRKGNELDEHTIRQELDGNLCRCTGYHNIVKAIAAGAKAMKGTTRPRNFARSSSSRRKAMSSEAAHEPRPGSAHRCAARKTSASSPARASTPTTSAVRARPGRCSCARRMRMPGSRRSTSTRRAKMPGVLAVLTGAELATDKIGNLICGWMIHSKDGSPMKMSAHPAIASGKACYVGDPVAVVVAETHGAGARRRREGRGRLRGAAGGDRSGQGAKSRRRSTRWRRRTRSTSGISATPRRRTRRSSRPSTSPSSTSSTTGWCPTRWSRALRSANTTPARRISRSGTPRRIRTWRGSSSPRSSAWRPSTSSASSRPTSAAASARRSSSIPKRSCACGRRRRSAVR